MHLDIDHCFSKSTEIKKKLFLNLEELVRYLLRLLFQFTKSSQFRKDGNNNKVLAQTILYIFELFSFTII